MDEKANIEKGMELIQQRASSPLSLSLEFGWGREEVCFIIHFNLL
jgi:hypothetical protein